MQFSKPPFHTRIRVQKSPVPRHWRHSIRLWVEHGKSYSHISIPLNGSVYINTIHDPDQWGEVRECHRAFHSFPHYDVPFILFSATNILYTHKFHHISTIKRGCFITHLKHYPRLSALTVHASVPTVFTPLWITIPPRCKNTWEHINLEVSRHTASAV